MAKILSQTGIETSNTVEAWHVTQSVDAFTGAEAYDITISGSLTLQNGTQGQNKIAVSDAGGKISFTSGITASLHGTASYASRALSASYASQALSASYASQALSSSYALTASYAISASYATTASHVNLVAGPNITINKVNNSFEISGSGGTPAGNNTEIQFNNNGNFGASSFFIFNPSTNSFEQGNTVTASGNYSHAEGSGSNASGPSSHAEGQNTKSVGTGSHAEGYFTISSGSYSHAEGYQTTASGDYSHAEGFRTIASGSFSHAEGWLTTASGNYSHAEGYGTTAGDWYSHAEGAGINENVFPIRILAGGNAVGLGSHAEGAETYASGYGSHAEGYETTASGHYSHAEGGGVGEVTLIVFGTPVPISFNAPGGKAGGLGSHAEGARTLTLGGLSHAEGYLTTASAFASHAEGYGTIAYEDYQHVSGEWNNINNSNQLFIIGNGTDNATRSNAFRVSDSGQIYGSGASYNSGADYAEYFESHNGQSIPVGTVVELTGSYIKPCENPDNAIGVISSNPTMVGNTEDGTADEWVGKYEKDEWGRYIMEDYIPEHLYNMVSGSIEATGSFEAITRKRPKLNPNFDPNKPYVQRSERPEWNIVGLMGQIKVLKDQPINSRWIKMKDINDNIALYLVR